VTTTCHACTHETNGGGPLGSHPRPGAGKLRIKVDGRARGEKNREWQIDAAQKKKREKKNKRRCGKTRCAKELNPGLSAEARDGEGGFIHSPCLLLYAALLWDGGTGSG